MKLYNKVTGQLGEGIALQYLEKKGLELVSRNFSTRFGEIDLIMRDKEVTVFVEVKAKKTEDWGTPEEMFTQSKYRKVKNMAVVFLKGKEVPCRIDMVAIVLDPDNSVQRLDHYENVVL
jgi:putative endonuclease